MVACRPKVGPHGAIHVHRRHALLEAPVRRFGRGVRARMVVAVAGLNDHRARAQMRASRDGQSHGGQSTFPHAHQVTARVDIQPVDTKPPRHAGGTTSPSSSTAWSALAPLAPSRRMVDRVGVMCRRCVAASVQTLANRIKVAPTRPLV